MRSVLSGFLPIWTVTALGWIAGRYRILGDNAQTVLGRFAFTFAMPSLLFLTMSTSHVSAVATPSVAAFALALLTVFALGLALSRWVFRRSLADQSIGAMCAAYVNSANLGIPIAVNVLHDTSFIIAAALFQMLFITPLIIILIDLDTHRGLGKLWLRIVQLPFRNPVVAASAAGLLVAALGQGDNLPSELTSPLHTLGGAGVPSALFALGMSLNARTRTSPDGRTQRRLLVALKTFLQPAIAYVLARCAFGLTGHALFAVVLCSGLPTAQNAFIFASEYGLDTDLPRDTVLLSTLLSMASLSVIAYLLA
jgi:malonate transporter and related proteins